MIVTSLRAWFTVFQVEFILMGGTFMSLPADYRDYFIRNLHDALSGHTSANVEEAVAYSEHSATKCIGMTIETWVACHLIICMLQKCYILRLCCVRFWMEEWLGIWLNTWGGNIFEILMKWVNHMEVNSIVRTWAKPRKTTYQAFMMDFGLNDLSLDMIHKKTLLRLIHVRELPLRRQNNKNNETGYTSQKLLWQLSKCHKPAYCVWAHQWVSSWKRWVVVRI